MKEGHVLPEKSAALALRVVAAGREWMAERREDSLSRQRPRGDTSIGANVADASGGQSTRHFEARRPNS